MNLQINIVRRSLCEMCGGCNGYCNDVHAKLLEAYDRVIPDYLLEGVHIQGNCYNATNDYTPVHLCITHNTLDGIFSTTTSGHCDNSRDHVAQSIEDGQPSTPMTNDSGISNQETYALYSESITPSPPQADGDVNTNAPWIHQREGIYNAFDFMLNESPSAEYDIYTDYLFDCALESLLPADLHN